VIGRTISHYRITEKLGEGGMGVVYKAEDTKLDRPVALKFLAAHLVGDDEGRERFLREAKAAAALDHNNICTVHEIDEADGQTFLAMAFIEGQSLKDKIAERPLKLDEALDLAMQTARGLEAAHKKGIVHRDIKPANLMLSGDGTLKIMDFGLAQLAGRTKLTKTGSSLGTPAYMSPEQTLGETTDHRSDIWSLGVVLYEMVTGQLPFKGEAEPAVAYGIVNEDPEPLTALRTGVPVELDRIASKALAKDPNDRYQHVDELLVDLRGAREREGSAASKRVAVPMRQPPERKVTALWAAMVASLLAAAGLTWWLTQASPERPTIRPPVLTRLTTDTGLTFEPSLSKDGQLLSYTSDRAGDGNLDIWVQQVGGGSRVRLTDHPADDSQPDFSPDGRTVAFQSDRDGGGIYLVPALGGEARLLVKGSAAPRFSPDGSKIAYSVNAGPYSGEIYVVSSNGGQPRRLATEGIVSSPAWSPNGDKLLFGDRASGDWWVAPIEGGPAVQTGASALLREHGIGGLSRGTGGTQGNLLQRESTWVAEGNYVVFAGGRNDSTNVWRIAISPDTGKVTGVPEQLTYGAGIASLPAPAADGRFAFANLMSQSDIWSLPINANTAKVTGAIQRLTDDGAWDTYPTVPQNGKTLVFQSNRSGNRDVWIKDLGTGTERALTNTPVNEARPRISTDGSVVFYNTVTQTALPDINFLPAQGGVPTNVCEGCGAVLGISSDARQIITHRGTQTIRLFVMDVASRQETEILRRSTYRRFHPQISPDGRWIAFGVEKGNSNRQIFVAPFRDGVSGAEVEWIEITDDSFFSRFNVWSPNGQFLYFASDQDGNGCIWAQELDPDSKRAVGSPIAIHHSHSAHRVAGRITGGFGNLSVAEDKLVIGGSELTGNIWLAEPQQEDK